MDTPLKYASKMIEKKADYVLAVKDNQGLLAEQVRDSFLLMDCGTVSEEIDCGHGRVERRCCSVIADLSSVGARRVGAGEAVLEAEFATCLGELERAVGWPVVGEHGLEADAQPGVPVQRGAQAGDPQDRQVPAPESAGLTWPPSSASHPAPRLSWPAALDSEPSVGHSYDRPFDLLLKASCSHNQLL